MTRNIKKYLFFRDWAWYFLVNGTKRFIGQVDMEAEIAMLEEEAAIACGAYDEEVLKVICTNQKMLAEKMAIIS